VQHDARIALALPDHLEDLASVIPASILKNVSYLRRRAYRDGLTALVDEATPATFSAMFDTLVRLHRRRWASRGHAGVLTNDLEAFHRDAAPALLQRGLLRMYILHFEGDPAAAFYGFAAKGRTAYYLGGFDPTYERYSPGTMLIAHAVERAVTVDHDHTFDFLRGREAYKLGWGATEQPLYRWIGSLAPSRPARLGAGFRRTAYEVLTQQAT
jgi:CelD/BcsL family acetyltransferase involved in cellulose biosynthesis